MSEGAYLGALDQGTTGSRFIVFDAQGRIVRQAYKRHRQFYPNPGWVEHDPKELLSNVRAVIRACLKGTDFKLAAIGLTNSRSMPKARSRRDGPNDRRSDGAPLEPLLLRDQDGLAKPTYPGRSGGADPWQALPRHRGQLASLASDRALPDRTDKRFTNDADEP